MHGIDLRVVPEVEAYLPITDLTLRRGFGAFDFLRVSEGVPVFAGAHLDRFERSISRLGLQLPVARAALERHVDELVRANGGGDLGLQLFLTAGDPDDGPEPGRARLLALAASLPRYPRAFYEQGVALLPHEHVRDLPEAKTTNYFTGLRLAPALREAGAIDALYHDGERVLETSRCSLFVVLADGGLVTAGRDVLPSVTRAEVIASLGGKRPVAERDVTWGDVRTAREAFLASTTKAVMPVVRIGDRRVGDGAPGPVTREVSERFLAHRRAHVLERARTSA